MANKGVLSAILKIWTRQPLYGPFELIRYSVAGLEIKKMSGRKFATGYENLVATLKMLVVKLIEAI